MSDKIFSMKKILVGIFTIMVLMLSLSMIASADTIVVETEDFNIYSNFSIVSDASASGGKYISAMSNTWEDYKNESEMGAPQTEYKFTTTTAGNHSIYIRVANPSAFNGDSCRITLDGTLHEIHFGSYDLNFYWKSVGMAKLYPGEHTLRIYSREFGAMLDKMIITSNLAFIPVGKDDIPLKDTYTAEDLPTPVPSQKPPAEHPRLLLRKSDLPKIRANLTHPQNIGAYNRVLELSESIVTGNTAAYSEELLEVLQAKAVMYLIEGNQQKGREAVDATMNYLRAYPKTFGSAYDVSMRFAGHIIFATSCVYDWCYDLFTTEEKTEFIEHCKDIATAHFEGGYPIIEKPNTVKVYEHRDENPLYKDLLAFGIAVYDEDPFTYDDVLGVLYANYFPWRNVIYPGGWAPQGVSTYGTFRTTWEIFCAHMLDVIGQNPFVDDQHYYPYKYVYFRRPDGAYYTDCNETRKVFDNTFTKNNHGIFFMLGNLYKDPVIKWYYYHDIASTVYTDTYMTGISAPMYLVMNDVDVELENRAELPLTRYFGSPVGAMIARTSWEEGADSPAAIAVMKVFENYFSGHQHREVGNFQFYYKGMLALDSGAYEAPDYVDENGNVVPYINHYTNYHTNPIAHNCLIVYDPANPSEIAAGGQRMMFQGYSALGTLQEFLDGSHKTGEVTGYDFGPDKNEPEYSYLEGDLTSGYKSDRVKDYSRSYMFLNLFDDTIPAALIVYDRMESTNRNYKKSWLLHSQEEPIVDGNKVTIKRTELHNNGRLIDSVLLPNNAEITKIGGEGYEYWDGVKNNPIKREEIGDESGTWRVEISPDSQNTKDYFLNVMQVSENDESITPLDVTSDEQGQFIGIYIADRAVYMKKDKGTVSSGFDITADGDGDISYIITNLAEGSWTVSGNSFTYTGLVDDEHGVLRFRAPAGTYTLTRTVASVSPKTFNVLADSVMAEERPVSLFVNNKHYDGKAIIKDDVIMIALSDIAGITGGNTNIDGDSFTAVGKSNSISGIVGNKGVTINGVDANLTVAPIRYKDTIYIALQDAHSVFDFEAEYDDLTYILYISSNPVAKIMIDGYTVENFRWYNQHGLPVTDIAPGDKLSVNASFTRNYGKDDPATYKATLYAALYDGDEVVSFKAVDGEFANYGDTKFYNISMDVPNKSANYNTRLFLWQSDILKPLALSSESADAAITGISLNGVDVEDFDSDEVAFDVTIPYTEEYPQVVCKSNSVGVQVQVEFSASLVIITASTPSSTKKYIVNYTVEKPELTDIAFTQYEWLSSEYYNKPSEKAYTVYSGDDLKIAKAISLNLNEVEDKTQTLGEYLNISSAADMASKVTPQFSTASETPKWYYSNIHKDFDGLNMILTPYVNGVADKQGTVWGFHSTMTFTTGKSIRIYYSNEDATVGWSNSDAEFMGEYVFNVNRTGSYPACANQTIQEILDTTNNSNTQFVNKIYKQDIIVPDGSEFVTVTVRLRSGMMWNPTFFAYEFIEDEPMEEPELSELFITDATIRADGIEPMTYGVINEVRLPLYTQDIRYDSPTFGKYYLGPVVGSNGEVVWGTPYANRLNADDYYYIQSCPAEMLGAKILFWKKAYGINKNSTNVIAKFTINRTATLYFDAPNEYIESSGAQEVKGDLCTLIGGVGYNECINYYLDNPKVAGTPYHGGRLYKLELVVPEGSSSATFEIPLKFHNNEHPIAFIK